MGKSTKRRLSSKPTIDKIAKIFGKKFKIMTGSQNRFYFGKKPYYEPDIVIRSKRTGRIKALVEVEQGTRKHVVGGVITADYCMGLQNMRPVFIVIALTKQDLKDYRNRLHFLKSYVKNLSRIKVFDKTEAIHFLKNLK